MMTSEEMLKMDKETPSHECSEENIIENVIQDLIPQAETEDEDQGVEIEEVKKLDYKTLMEYTDVISNNLDFAPMEYDAEYKSTLHKIKDFFKRCYKAKLKQADIRQYFIK
jgi:hypothetical protein